MNCETCAYWIATPTVGGGSCRRYAPRPSDSKLNQTYWPRTEPTAFCGEWEEKLKMSVDLSS
jgi:hypothetical protein